MSREIFCRILGKHGATSGYRLCCGLFRRWVDTAEEEQKLENLYLEISAAYLLGNRVKLGEDMLD